MRKFLSYLLGSLMLMLALFVIMTGFFKLHSNDLLNSWYWLLFLTLSFAFPFIFICCIDLTHTALNDDEKRRVELKCYDMTLFILIQFALVFIMHAIDTLTANFYFSIWLILAWLVGLYQLFVCNTKAKIAIFRNAIEPKKILFLCKALGRTKTKTPQKIRFKKTNHTKNLIIQFCLLFIHKRYVSLYAKALCNKYARLFVISMLLSFVLAFVTVVVIRLFFVITPFNQAFAFLYLTTGFHLILVSLSQTIIVRTCFDAATISLDKETQFHV